jgi:hypothetical protein
MKKIIYTVYFIGLLLTPVILLILPSNFFDEGQSICLSYLLFDTECYACGLTRAIQHLIHFDFSIAYEYNKLSIIVFPFLMLSYYKETRRVFNLVRSI